MSSEPAGALSQTARSPSSPSAYTPGPWHFNGRRITTGVHIVADVWDVNQPVGIANGNLLAAAPELLAVAKSTLTLLEHASPGLPGIPELRALIARAEGQQS